MYICICICVYRLSEYEIGALFALFSPCVALVVVVVVSFCVLFKFVRNVVALLLLLLLLLCNIFNFAQAAT